VTTDLRLAAATATILQNVGHPLEALEQSDALTELAHALAAVVGTHQHNAPKAITSLRSGRATT